MGYFPATSALLRVLFLADVLTVSTRVLALRFKYRRPANDSPSKWDDLWQFRRPGAHTLKRHGQRQSESGRPLPGALSAVPLFRDGFRTSWNAGCSSVGTQTNREDAGLGGCRPFL